jgi:hypothetical protein
MAIQKRIVVGGGSAAAEGFYFKWADDSTPLFIDEETALENYNPSDPDNHTDWSIYFVVDGDKFNTSIPPTYDDGTDDFDGDASNSLPQTFFRLPIIRDSNRLSLGGVYKESIFCEGNKGPIVEFIKVG